MESRGSARVTRRPSSTDETKAVIVLTAGKSINVQQTVEQIQNAIEGATTRQIPLIDLSDDRGTQHRINVNQIVEFHEPIKHESATFMST